MLLESLKSAVNQTYGNLEILVLDDASSDETAATVGAFAIDPRIRYVRRPVNVGIAANWRTGIEMATGEFFCILHDDDTFEPTFVEQLLAPLVRDSSLILSTCDHWVMDASGVRSVAQTEEASKHFGRDKLACGTIPDWRECCLINLSFPVGATIFRRSMVLPSFIDERANGAIDYWLYYQCAKTGAGAYYETERLMNYRLHAGGMSRIRGEYMTDGHIFRYESILGDPDMFVLATSVRRALADALISKGMYQLCRGESKGAREALAKGIAYCMTCRGFVTYVLAHMGKLGPCAVRALKHEPWL